MYTLIWEGRLDFVSPGAYPLVSRFSRQPAKMRYRGPTMPRMRLLQGAVRSQAPSGILPVAGALADRYTGFLTRDLVVLTEFGHDRGRLAAVDHGIMFGDLWRPVAKNDASRIKAGLPA